MKKILTFNRFFEAYKSVEVGYDPSDTTSNSLNTDSLDNLEKEMSDYKKYQSKVDKIIMDADENTDVSKELEKIIVNKNTYGTNRFLRMYSSIAHKNKQVSNLEDKIKNRNQELSDKKSELNSTDKSDTTAIKNINDSIKKIKNDIVEDNKKLKELERDIKDKDSEIKMFIKDLEKSKKDDLKSKRWEESTNR